VEFVKSVGFLKGAIEGGVVSSMKTLMKGWLVCSHAFCLMHYVLTGNLSLTASLKTAELLYNTLAVSTKHLSL
jgi:hypothetical protein